MAEHFIQITLIGGPADLQRHVVKKPAEDHFTVLQELPLGPTRRVLDYYEAVGREYCAAAKHRYQLIQVAGDTYIGLHESMWRW